MNYRHDKRYVGLRNYLTDRSLFGLKFAYETIPKEIYPFDWETYQNSPTEIRVGVTNIETGEAEYLDGKELEETCSMLKATCAIPFVFPPIEINGKKYYDGGICDPIPVRKAEADGHGKMLIVLTRPKGYIKTLSKANVQAAKMLRKKYPKLVEVLEQRAKVYNKTLYYIDKWEKEGKVFVLRPEIEPVARLERDTQKLENFYQHGYDLMEEKFEEMKWFLNR